MLLMMVKSFIYRAPESFSTICYFFFLLFCPHVTHRVCACVSVLAVGQRNNHYVHKIIKHSGLEWTGSL